MKISQRKFSTKTSFSFEDDGLTYEVRDGSGAVAFRADYEDISFETSYSEERNLWLRNAGYFWVAIGILATIMRGPTLSLWLLLGIGCLIAYFWRRIAYTIFDAPKGRILVIRDDKHDEIINEIISRRRACLRSRYATVDPTNTPQNEERRFGWLLEHEIISNEEHTDALKQIRTDFADHDEP